MLPLGSRYALRGGAEPLPSAVASYLADSELMAVLTERLQSAYRSASGVFRTNCCSTRCARWCCPTTVALAAS